MNRILHLTFCVDILENEFEKIGKKYAEINTRIDEGFYLSPKKFDNLCKKKDILEEKIIAFETGINYLNGEIEQLKYIENRRKSNNEH